MTERRAAFVASKGFPLDEYQQRALDALDAGRSVLVAAPTGSGKTVVAEYAVERALAAGGKVFYTTPLKALSNQKYGDFVHAYGSGRVGLLTGDNSINGEAAVVVMTTEVLRNMIYAGSPTLSGLRYVVLDEVHYLQNPYRGAVWEEVIIHLPPEVDLVCLSATVSNAEEVADWIQTVRGETEAVIEERRPVELHHLFMVGDRRLERILLLPSVIADGGELRPNPEGLRLETPTRRPAPGGRGFPPARRGRLYAPSRVEVVERLAEESMLPVIEFIFSRMGCDQAVDQCMHAGLRFTDTDERAEIRRIAEAKVELLADDDLRVLGYGHWLAALEAGFAAHHAGMVPPMKEAVEQAFAAGLVKVVFATETLSLGINMPARSVVIEKLRKYTGDGWQDLTSGEYTQLTGRAGRRGIDDVGYAIVLWSPFTSFATVASLASKRSYVLESSFRPTYNMASNLVQRYAADVAHHLLNLSFAQYRRDRGIVQQERELERKQQLLVIEERAARCECGDVEEYRRRLTRAQRDERDGPRREAGIPTLTPGEVVVLPRGDRAVVVQVIGRGGALVVTPSAKTVRVSARDLGRLARPGTSIELPGRFTPRSDTFKRELAQRLRTVKLPAVAVHKRTRRDPTQAALAEHPAAACPDLRSHLQHAGRAERLRRDVGALQQRIKQRSESLARQFDRVLGLLESWGYVDGWSLTDAGRLLARIYCECDLLVAESLRAGFFDGLTPPAVAALASCFTYETRGPGAERRAVAPVRWPQRGLRDLWGKIERLSRDLALAEHDGSLTETRAPDPGFAVAAYRWATGDDLEDVLDDDNELTGGDFVRNMKQLIDLLRQIGDVAPAPTAAAARDAAGALFRGVVAASAVVGA